jgi:hypothetical protein
MQSSLLLEYMRTGNITPLKKGDSKNEVEAKLGAPDDWKGRRGGIGWEGPLLTDYHDSWAWHYGSLCVSFPQPELYGLPGISLSYSDVLKPIGFPPPFTALPHACFTLRELIDLLREADVQFSDNRDDRDARDAGAVIVSEGGVGVFTLHGNCSPKAQVTHLFPHEFTCA